MTDISFSDFLSINDLQSQLDFFEHEVSEDSVLLENERVTWAVAKERIFGPLAPGRLPNGWKYNQHGLVKKNLIRWTKLEADWVEKGADRKANRCFVELISTQSVLRHCWLRLIDEEGKVISVGFCGKVHPWKPLRGQKGKLVSPDPFEFKPCKQLVTRIEISPEEHNRLKERIERDQADKNLYFNLMTRNCSVYACEVLKEIGIEIENTEFPSQALARTVLNRLGLKLPACIRAAFHSIASIFRLLYSPVLHSIVFLLGGTSQDTDITEIEKEHGEKWPEKPRKPFQNFWSLFNGSNFALGTGWKVMNWQEKVAELREGVPEDEKYAKPDPNRVQPHSLGYSVVLSP